MSYPAVGEENGDAALRPPSGPGRAGVKWRVAWGTPVCLLLEADAAPCEITHDGGMRAGGLIGAR